MKYYVSFLSMSFFITNALAIGINFDEPKTIKSDVIEYNIKTEEMKASGNTEMINASGQRVKLNNLTISKDKETISSNDIELWLGKHVYISAEEINRSGNETVAIDAEFTACDGCDDYGNAWQICSKKIIHDANEKMLYFHNASFWIYDDMIPVLWLPYYEMPDPSVKYKSGFLTPSLNSTNDMGLQINIPFYVNFSNTHDLTPTVSYLTDENPLFQLEHRLNLQHSEFRTKGSFTHNKEGENRWHIYNDDKIELGENARATVYIARTSDKTYLQKYGFYDYQPYLDSGAKVELFGQTSYVVADAHIFQELRQAYGNQHTISGNILPNIRGTYQTNPFFKETYLSLSGDVLGVSAEDSDSQRIIGEARVISPWTLWLGNRVTASVAARYDIYNFNNTAVYDNDQLNTSFSGVKSRFLPSGYVEWGLPLYSVENSWTYIIEPRARLTVMEHSNKNAVFALNNDSAGRFLSDTTLFSDNRFAGLDVWENGNFIDYGARWAAFNDNHNIEIFLGQTYDFNTESTDEDFNDNGFRHGFSDYVGRIAYAQKYFEISSRFRFDRKDMGLSHIENSLYVGNNGYYLTFGHIWDTHPIDVFSTNDKDTHEVSAGAGLPITNRLRIAGSVIYNAYEHIVQKHSAGLFYEHPCYHFSFEYSRDNTIKNDYVGNTTYRFKIGMSIDGKYY